MQILKARLYDEALRKTKSETAQNRKEQVGSGDRSERIRTYNYPQGRITDHRIGVSVYQMDSFMNGYMEPIIDRLIEADLNLKIKEGEGNG